MNWHHCWALTGGTDWQHCIDGHWWVALVGGTDGWHCWAQVGALLGTGGWNSGHRWAELVGSTAGHRSLSEREESTAENQQLSEQGSAPIIRALMISALMIGAQQCHPPVPPTCAHQCCPAVHPPVPSSAPTS
ncbi:unnamed protein product, partial [Staurois parvus]